jgi:hypothetical protein
LLEEDEELKTCISEIENLIAKEKQRDLHLRIKELEKQGDSAKVKELLEEFKNLIKYEEKNKEKACFKEEVKESKENEDQGESKTEEKENTEKETIKEEKESTVQD